MARGGGSRGARSARAWAGPRENRLASRHTVQEPRERVAQVTAGVDDRQTHLPRPHLRPWECLREAAATIGGDVAREDETQLRSPRAHLRRAGSDGTQLHLDTEQQVADRLGGCAIPIA